MHPVYIAIAPDPQTGAISPSFVYVFKFATQAAIQVERWREEGKPAYYIEKYCSN